MMSSTIWLARLSNSIKFDGNREVTRDGLPRITPGGDNLIDTLNNFLYPDQRPGVIISVEGLESLKQFNDPDLSVNLLYTVSKGSASLISIIIDASDNLEDGSGEDQSGIYTAEIQQNQNKIFNISVMDENNMVSNSSTSVQWKHGLFYGALAVDPTTLKDQLLNTPVDMLGFSDQLCDNKSVNKNFDCSGGKYIYIAYPQVFGDPLEVKTDAFDFTDYDVENIQLIDQFGVVNNYKLFYTNLQTGSDININIIS